MTSPFSKRNTARQLPKTRTLNHCPATDTAGTVYVEAMHRIRRESSLSILLMDRNPWCLIFMDPKAACRTRRRQRHSIRTGHRARRGQWRWGHCRVPNRATRSLDMFPAYYSGGPESGSPPCGIPAGSATCQEFSAPPGCSPSHGPAHHPVASALRSGPGLRVLFRAQASAQQVDGHLGRSCSWSVSRSRQRPCFPFHH